MVKEAGNVFGRTTTSRHDRSPWVAKFVDFGKKVYDRSARSGG